MKAFKSQSAEEQKFCIFECKIRQNLIISV